MSQSLALGPIPLEKYSYADSKQNVRHHTWNHDTRREVLLLKVVRADASVVHNDLRVLVMAGAQVLETLNIPNLVRWAREHEQRIRHGLIPAQTEPPVQVVVKPPCIAMKLPRDNSLVRRFQVKFANDRDYLTLRDLLRDVGLPMKEAAVARPDSRASITRLTPSSPALPEWQRSTAQHHSQPSTGLRPSSTHHGLQFQSLITDRAETSSAQSMRPPSILSPDIEILRSSSAMDFANGRSSPNVNYSLQQPQMPAMFAPIQPRFTSDPPFQMPPIHQTTEAGSGRMEAWQSSRAPHATVQHATIRDENNVTQGTTHDGRKMQGTPATPYEGSRTPPYLSEASKLKRSSTAQGSQAEGTHGYEPLSQVRHHSALNESIYRPMSTPITGPQYDMSRLDTSSWIPPKRDLPFPKAKEAKRIDVAPQSTRQVTFTESAQVAAPQRAISPDLDSRTLNTPPAPPQTPPPQIAKPARKRAVPRKKTAGTAPPRDEIPDSQERVPRTATYLPEEPISPLISRASAIPRPATAPPGKAAPKPRKRASNTNIAPPAKIAKMVDSSTQTQTGSRREHTALPRSVTVSQPIPPAVIPESVAPNGNASIATATPQAAPLPASQPTSEDLDRVYDRMERFVERFSRPGQPVDIDELPGWDTAMEDERHDITESWMIEQLQDQRFIGLCRTLRATWQRIGIPW